MNILLRILIGTIAVLVADMLLRGVSLGDMETTNGLLTAILTAVVLALLTSVVAGWWVRRQLRPLEPLIGANVVAKETSGVGTITDIDGNYNLQVPQNVNVLVFSYAGYNSQEMEIGTSTLLM